MSSLTRVLKSWHLLTCVLTSPLSPKLTFPPCFRLQQLMHAIVMVHKMQRMALSSHQLLGPAAAGAEKADSENTRNSDKNHDDEAKGEEDEQGD